MFSLQTGKKFLLTTDSSFSEQINLQFLISLCLKMFPTCVSQAHDAMADPDAPIACRVEEVVDTQKKDGLGKTQSEGEPLQKMVEDHANGSV